jgi:hypothetical protein
MQNKATQNKELCTLRTSNFSWRAPSGVQKPRSINELLRVGGKRLTALKLRAHERTAVLELVCAALPPRLAETVVSAGLEHGRLTIGVVSAPWASRLRYVTDALRLQVGAAMGVPVQSVRIKVAPPRI